MFTIQAALDLATTRLTKHSDSAALDSEILLALVLEKNRTYLCTWPEKLLTSEQQAQFEHLLQQRLHGMPVAYLTGEREFWSRSFKVNSSVLIPRPDTEVLIELSLALMPKNQAGKIIDLGTGSGIIGITLAAERPQAQVIATDISRAALSIALENAARHQVTNIRFQHSHWFNQIAETEFDLVVSNPPYISADDPHLQDLSFEPSTALIAAENGLQDISQIADNACQHLKSDGYLLVEHGFQQQTAVQTIFKQFGYRNIQTHRDFGGNPRVTCGQWQH